MGGGEDALPDGLAAEFLNASFQAQINGGAAGHPVVEHLQILAAGQV